MEKYQTRPVPGSGSVRSGKGSKGAKGAGSGGSRSGGGWIRRSPEALGKHKGGDLGSLVYSLSPDRQGGVLPWLLSGGHSVLWGGVCVTGVRTCGGRGYSKGVPWWRTVP